MVFQPSGPISFTKTTLSYPVYSADFDPYNRGYLVVAGGGGEGRSGVGNKIVRFHESMRYLILFADHESQTLLDAAQPGSLDTVTEIDLSKEEDSVTSIASLASRDGLIVFAGINSSEAEQKTGKNEHLRTFQVKYPKRKRPGDAAVPEKDDALSKNDESEGSITLTGKTAFFTPATGPKPEQYQRLLRLSPAFKRESGNRRIGAVATGLSKQSEIVIFDATRTPPKESEIISKIAVRDNGEAADLDIMENVSEKTFSIAWCTDYDVYEQTLKYDFSTGKAEFAPTNPRKIHSIPLRDDATKPPRAKYRSLRWLTDEDILLVTNLPNKSGAELQILHLYPTGPALVLLHKILPSHVKQAVALDVCGLDYDSNGNRQVVVAVAGQDISICVFTIDYNGLSRTFSPFKKFTTLRDVHPVQMTALTFSTFHSPIRAPLDAPEDVKGGERRPGVPVPKHPLPQNIKLCSASMGNTVVVETMSLTPLDPASRTTRYVLSHPADRNYTRNLSIGLISFIVLVSAILLQSLLLPDSTPITDLIPIPQGLRSFLSHPANVADGFGRGGKERVTLLARSASSAASDVSAATSDSAHRTAHKLSELLHLHLPSALSSSGSSSADTKALIVRDDPDETSVSVDVIEDRETYLKQDVQAREWHELAEHEKEVWRRRLQGAGRWSVNEGESVLKGILFSSWAGLVGQVAGEVIREL